MSQTGSGFRRKYLGGKLKVAMGDSVFQSRWRRKDSVGPVEVSASISCPVGGLEVPQSPNRLWLCGFVQGVKARVWAWSLSRRGGVCAPTVHLCECVLSGLWQDCRAGTVWVVGVLYTGDMCRRRELQAPP